MIDDDLKDMEAVIQNASPAVQARYIDFLISTFKNGKKKERYNFLQGIMKEFVSLDIRYKNLKSRRKDNWKS